MKKSSFQRGRGFGQTRYLSVGQLRTLGIVVGVLLLVWVLRMAAPNVFSFLVSPLWNVGAGTTASVGQTEGFFASKASLIKKIELLEQENATLKIEKGILAAKSGDHLRLLGTRQDTAPGIVAGVLVRPPVSPYDVLVVDQGVDQGVLAGASVYGAGGVPVGTVASVSGHTSRVLMYSASGRETEAWVGEARTPITLVGQGSGAFTALVSREAKVLVGDTVYVSGPGSLPIGTVVAVEDNPSSPKVSIKVRPVVNPFSITWVSISYLSGL